MLVRHVFQTLAIIVRLAIENGILVRLYPCKLRFSALSISGFINTEYAFYGFMPRKKSAFIEKLKSLSKYSYSRNIRIAHRIFNLFSAIDEAFPI